MSEACISDPRLHRKATFPLVTACLTPDDQARVKTRNGSLMTVQRALNQCVMIGESADQRLLQGNPQVVSWQTVRSSAVRDSKSRLLLPTVHLRRVQANSRSGFTTDDAHRHGARAH